MDCPRADCPMQDIERIKAVLRSVAAVATPDWRIRQEARLLLLHWHFAQAPEERSRWA